MDVWVSDDGAHWEQVSDSPWNAVAPSEIKYDFAALALDRPGGNRSSIYTFGGDRETFDFTDPTNYLNVDNDVWRFAPPMRRGRKTDDRRHGRAQPHSNGIAMSAAPNPFNPTTNITYSLPAQQSVDLAIYDVSGRLVRNLVNQQMPAGEHTVQWDATDSQGNKVASGIYLYRLQSDDLLVTKQIVLLK